MTTVCDMGTVELRVSKKKSRTNKQTHRKKDTGTEDYSHCGTDFNEKYNQSII